MGCDYEDWGDALGSVAHAAAEVTMTYVLPRKYTSSGRAATVFAVEAVPNAQVMQSLRNNIAGIATDHPDVTIVMHYVGHSERLLPNEVPPATSPAVDRATEEAARLSMYPVRPTETPA